MTLYIVYTQYRTQDAGFKPQCRLIGDLPVSLHQIFSFLQGRTWEQLPPDIQKRGNKEPGLVRRKPKNKEWAIPVNEFEWRYIQKCWERQYPGLVLINSMDQLLNDVTEITGDHHADKGVVFGVSFNFALDITGLSPGDLHIDEIYNEARRHFLLAKSCLRQIKTLNGQLPTAVVDDFADLEITLDEFFMAPQQSVSVQQ